MRIEPDRIELATVIKRPLAEVWSRVSEPGWFINEGALTDHVVEWDGERVRVCDPDHGDFLFVLESMSERREITFSSGDPAGDRRQVRFDCAPVEEGTVVRVLETGFATTTGSASDRVDAHTQNTRTWLAQLQLIKIDLEQQN